MIKIEVSDAEARAALKALTDRAENLAPVLKAIGEVIAERASDRFGTSTGPDGQRWEPNARATIEAFLRQKSGEYAKYSDVDTRQEKLSRVGNKKGFYDKKGQIASRGIAAVLSKLPLVQTKELGHTIHSQLVGNNAVEIGTNRFAGDIKGGAAIHQFGGQAGKGHKVTIPARPFLPITRTGELYQEDRALVICMLNNYIAGK